MMTDDRPEITAPRPEMLRTALGLLAGMGIATLSFFLLRRKRKAVRPPQQERSLSERLAQTGLEILPLLLPLLLEQRRKEPPAAVAEAPKPRRARHLGAYAWPILLCLALGGLAGWLQRPALAEWYPTQLKPAGTPPNWLFPVAWGTIYILMGISAGRILTATEGSRREVLILWGLQLGVNFLWSILFFVGRSPLAGMIAIVVLDALVVLYIARSYPVRRGAAWLFVPYLVWLLYATYLNGWILAMNGPGI